MITLTMCWCLLGPCTNTLFLSRVEMKKQYTDEVEVDGKF